MKAYRKQRQYFYHNCQLCNVTTGDTFIIYVCILMLQMVRLTSEHVQLATTPYMKPINQWHVHRHHITLSQTPLVLSSLNNVLPAMVLENSVVRLSISCSLYTSSHFSVCHTPFNLHLNFLCGLGWRVLGVVLVLLLLLSGDIETNPGPVGELSELAWCKTFHHTYTMLHSQPTGQQLSVNDLPVVMEQLNKACVKWYNIGMMLQVEIDKLDSIKERYSDHSDCLRETLKIWLKIYPPCPTWTNIIDALRSSTVGKTKLAADLEQKFCSTQEASVAATQHPVAIPAVAPSQVHSQTTPPPQSSPVFGSSYYVPPRPHPSYPPPWSAHSYYPSPPTSDSTSPGTPPTSQPPTMTPPTEYTGICSHKMCELTY